MLMLRKTLHFEELTGNDQRDIDGFYALPPIQAAMGGQGEFK
jgi:hypothetical protein